MPYQIPGAAGAVSHLFQAFQGGAPANAVYQANVGSANSMGIENYARAVGVTFSDTNAVLATKVLANVGISATTTNPVAYQTLLQGLTEAYAAFPRDRGLVTLNLTDILSGRDGRLGNGLESNATYGAAAIEFNRLIGFRGTHSNNPASTEFSNTPLPPAVIRIQGVAIDGLVSGAQVFVDLNGNGVADAGEPTTTTDAQGNYSIVSPITNARLVAIGGTSIDTGLPNTLALVGRTVAGPNSANELNLTPLTTLADSVARLLANGQPITQAILTQADNIVKTHLGLTGGESLQAINPVTDPGPAALEIYQRGVALANLVSGAQAAATVDNNAATVPGTIQTPLLDSIARELLRISQSEPTTRVDLANSVRISTFLGQALANSSAATPALIAGLAAANQQIDNATSVASVSQLQQNIVQQAPTLAAPPAPAPAPAPVPVPPPPPPPPPAPAPTAPSAPTAVTLTPVGGTVLTNTLNSTNTHLEIGATITAGQATGGKAEFYVGTTKVGEDNTISATDTTVTYTTSDGSPTNAELKTAIAAGGAVSVKLINAANLTATSAVANPTLAVDYLAPTVTITDNKPNTVTVADGNGGAITYTFTFSEAVIGFTAASVVATNGTKGTYTAATGNDAGKVYTLVVTPTANLNGNVTVALAANQANDVAGNGNATATNNVQAVNLTAPNTPPTSNNPTINAVEDTAKVLAATDFGPYADTENTPLVAIKITSLPTKGALEYNTTGTTWVAVTINQDTTKSDLDAGKLRYTPVSNENGTGYATLGFKVGDGTDFSTSNYTLTANVTAVNDAPLRTAGTLNAITVNEDSANTMAVSLGLTGLTYGPGGGTDEASQTLTYTLTAIPTFIKVFKVDGTTEVAVNGTVTATELAGLTYKTLADANGTGTVSIKVTDSGNGTAPDVNTVTENLNVTATAVNDAPVRTAGALNAITVAQDSANTTAASLGLSALVYGPGGGADENAQTLTYTLTTIPTFMKVFKVDGSTEVAINGTVTAAELMGLTYKTVAGANGTGNVGITVTDNGSGTAPNVNTVTQNLSITVTPGASAPTGTPVTTPTVRTSAAAEASFNPNLTFNDPLFGSQWNLVNTGQRYKDDDQNFEGAKTKQEKIDAAKAKNGGMLLDINVMDAWKTGYTGKGIVQSVSDDGFDLAHEDIQNNLLRDLAYNGATNAKAVAGDYENRTYFNAPKQEAGVPAPQRGDSAHQHGTVVGSIAANQANNGKGIVGIAFESKLIPALILDTSPDANTAQHLSYLRSNNVAVSLNSYGADPAFSENYGDYNGNLLTTTGIQAPAADDPQSGNLQLGKEIRLAAEQGRSGLGMVLEFSAGNERTTRADSALTMGTSSRYVIAVGAMDEVGDVTSYGSRGTNILVAAFGGAGNGDQKVNAGFGIVAGDNKAQLNAGYNNVDDTATASIDESAYSFFNTGTSYSGPTVGGVAALMLQANPNLGFRDVSTILALTARKVGAQATNQYVDNGAKNWNLGGLHHSDEGVGYGLVDATAAVRLAEQWTLAAQPGTRGTAANWKTLSGTNTANTPLAIPDNDSTTGLSVTVAVTATPDTLISIERVEFEIDLGASAPKELKAVVTSPSGTKVVIFDTPRADKAWPGVFSIGSSAFLGEKADGNWTLQLFDTTTGTMTDATFKSVKINAWGAAATADDQYYFTREHTTTDRVLSDTNGGNDTINAAAVHKAVTLNLVAGQTNSIGNDTATPGTFTIASGSVIENAIGGGGNDSITGNTANNVLRGSWGNDTLNGGAGNDTLVGGIGQDSLTGGTDSDVFVITELDATAATVSFLGDTITDFASGTDKIQLDVTALTRLAGGTWTGNTAGLTGKAGAQGANFFVMGAAATSAYAQLLYSAGELKVDIDGTGTASAVTLVTLTGTTTLAATDFLFTGVA